MRWFPLLALAGCLAAPPGNLLTNGDFAQGLDGWWGGGSTAPALVPAEAGGAKQAARLQLAPKPGANSWDIAFGHLVAAPIKEGDRVRLTVWARSPERCRMMLHIQQMKEPYTGVVGNVVTLTPVWAKYEAVGTSPRSFAPGEATVQFQLAFDPGTVELTAVQVEVVPAPPANPLNLIPFVLPWNDASGGVTNVSDLNPRPAGGLGFVTVRDGHLYTGDRRLRLMGTNITFDSAFPTHEGADQTAARMAKFGLNCVRFHHMDSRPGTLMLAQDFRHLNEANLERFDYFVNALKQQGIYTNLNLHVSRVYPGFPTWTGMPDFFKGIDLFYPPIIDLQKEYARELLTHVNPYTKTVFAQEPALAIVEINNENGLISSWFGGGLDAMPQVYVDELTKQWNAWLGQRYANEAAWRKAWQAEDQPLGAEMLRNGDFAQGAEGWTLETQGGAHATAEPLTTPQGKAIRLVVDQVDDQGWHVQFHQNGLSFKQGQRYTFSFRARADAARTLGVNIMMGHDPWHGYWNSNLNLTREWQSFSLVAIPTADDENGRVTFTNLGSEVGTVELAAVSFKPGGPYRTGAKDAWGQISWVPKQQFGSLPEQGRRDWASFLWDTETAYWTGMARFLKQELGVRAPIVGTAAPFSPAAIQAKLDVVDSHSYWQHPHFPHRPWDAVDWVVNNVPMAGVRDGGTLPGLATQRVAGKPFLVTEYNHPAPNTHNVEGFPLIAAFAAMQDWDGFFTFDYGGGRDFWDARRITGFFASYQHPTQMASLPLAADLFLRGDVAPASGRVEVVPSQEGMITKVTESGGWWSGGAFGLSQALALTRPVAMRFEGQAPAPPAAPTPPLVSAGGQWTWDNTQQPGRVLINTPRTKVLIGSTATPSCTLGDVVIAPGKNLQNWALIGLTQREGDRLGAPGTALLLAAGYAENTAMGWKDEKKDSVGADWGRAPSLVEGIPATITLPVPAARVTVQALDATGQPVKPVPVTDQGGQATFVIGPQYATLWYQVTVK